MVPADPLSAVLDRVRAAADRLDEVAGRRVPELAADPASDEDVCRLASAACARIREIGAAYGWPGDPGQGGLSGLVAVGERPGSLWRPVCVLGPLPGHLRECGADATLTHVLDDGVRLEHDGEPIPFRPERWDEVRVILGAILATVRARALALVTWTRDKIAETESAWLPLIRIKPAEDLPGGGQRHAVTLIHCGRERETTIQGTGATFLRLAAAHPDGEATAAYRYVVPRLIAALDDSLAGFIVRDPDRKLTYRISASLRRRIRFVEDSAE